VVLACVARIGAAAGDAFSLQADLSSTYAVKQLIDKVLEHYGRLDILVNNAGSMVARRRLEEVDDDFIDQVFDLNARSVVTVCRAVLPIFTAQGGGCIINVSSISARTGGSPGSSIYSASKAFVSTLTRSLARELAEQNIRVNALSPGTIDTAFHEQFSNPEKLEKTRLSIPLQRLGTAEDCAGTALYLAADSLSGYVTGQVIEVNGGQLMA
jgi:3-oxoacyl-[acyl-carrier protein] reductase